MIMTNCNLTVSGGTLGVDRTGVTPPA